MAYLGELAIRVDNDTDILLIQQTEVVMPAQVSSPPTALLAEHGLFRMVTVHAED